MEKWISTQESLPRIDENVLVYNCISKRIYVEANFWRDPRITHWMPLPAAPCEVEEAGA